jgi:hypothetical protein
LILWLYLALQFKAILIIVIFSFALIPFVISKTWYISSVLISDLFLFVIVIIIELVVSFVHLSAVPFGERKAPWLRWAS